MACEDRKVAGDAYIKVNNAAEGTLAADLTLTVDMTKVAADLVSADENNGLSVGTDNKLFAKAPDADLVDVYTAGQGISISGKVISVKLGADGGIKFDESGNLVVDFTNTISSDADNAIKAGADGKLSVKVVSADGGNLIKPGTDKGALLTEADITGAVTNIVNGMVDNPEGSLGCSMISETAGNQIQCDNGKLMVYSDYGTMDA